jgi:hypothetical protein
MGIINWVSFYLEKNITSKPKEKVKILGNQVVRNLSLKEVKRIAALGNNEKETALLSVYASRKFNSDLEDSLTDEEKKRIIDILYGTKGDQQFIYACSIVINTRSSRNRNVIESVSIVAGAEHPFQSKFSSFIALDSIMQRHDSFIRIIRILTLLSKDKATDFYDYIKRVEEAGKDTFEISRLVSEKLDEYERLMSVKSNEASKETIVDSVIQHKDPEDLKKKERESALLLVYADEKFSGENSVFTEEEKIEIIDIILSSKGDIQFLEACRTFCEIKTSNFESKTFGDITTPKNLIILKVIKYIAHSKNDYQARYSGELARDGLLQEVPCYTDLIRCMSKVESEETATNFNSYVQRILDDVDEYSNYQVPINLERSIKYYKNEDENIKVKTLKNTIGRRKKVER